MKPQSLFLMMKQVIRTTRKTNQQQQQLNWMHLGTMTMTSGATEDNDRR